MELKAGKEADCSTESKSKTERWCWRLLLLLTLSLLAAMVALTLVQYFKHWKSSRVSGHHGAIVPKYSEALQISMQFFDAQKCNINPILRFLFCGLFGTASGKAKSGFLSNRSTFLLMFVRKT